MPFNGRLLIAMDAIDPDIHLIRYASMVVRLSSSDPVNGASTNQRTVPLSTFPRDEYAKPTTTVGEMPEIRFVYLRPTQKIGEPAGPSREELHATLRRYFTGLSENVSVTCDLMKGHAFRRLADFATDFDCDVLLATDSPKFHPYRERLPMEAACPVWLVPPGWAPVLRRVLVPIDFTDRAATCLRAALDLMRDSAHAKCVALHVYHHAGRVVHPERDLSTRRSLHESFHAFMANIDTHGVTVEPVFVNSHRVDRAIARSAHHYGADLIMMSSRGRSRVAEFIQPSITQGVIHESRTAILVLKSSARPKGMWQALQEKLREPDDIQFS